jgi:hypothetical protein
LDDFGKNALDASGTPGGNLMERGKHLHKRILPYFFAVLTSADAGSAAVVCDALQPGNAQQS